VRIGIDATAVGVEPSTGMGSYSFNLVKNMLQINDHHEYVIYCCQAVHPVFREVARRATFRVSPMKNRKISEQFWLPLVTRRDRLDVFHGPCGLARFSPKVSVLTIHGLSWRIMPQVFTPLQRWYWIHCAERRMPRAKRIIAISQWTKNILENQFGVSADRIDVVHHGVNQKMFHKLNDPKAIAQVKHKHDLPDRFILFVGSILPVKNVPTLIRAYEALIRDARFESIKLVIAGIKGWGYGEVEQLVQQHQLQDRVLFTGRFPGEDLTALYNAAELFVLPSKYEGFGIPLIEAFSCGIPVVSSNASCLPEIGGDAAVYFDPDDIESLRDTMTRILSDKHLQTSMIEKGLSRATAFTWQRTAEQTLETYDRAISTTNVRGA